MLGLAVVVGAVGRGRVRVMASHDVHLSHSYSCQHVVRRPVHALMRAEGEWQAAWRRAVVDHSERGIKACSSESYHVRSMQARVVDTAGTYKVLTFDVNLPVEGVNVVESTSLNPYKSPTLSECMKNVHRMCAEFASVSHDTRCRASTIRPTDLLGEVRSAISNGNAGVTSAVR